MIWLHSVPGYCWLRETVARIAANLNTTRSEKRSGSGMSCSIQQSTERRNVLSSGMRQVFVNPTSETVIVKWCLAPSRLHNAPDIWLACHPCMSEARTDTSTHSTSASNENWSPRGVEIETAIRFVRCDEFRLTLTTGNWLAVCIRAMGAVGGDPWCEEDHMTLPQL